MRRIFFLTIFFVLLLLRPSYGVIHYQNFETDNGTPLNLVNPSAGVEFGWGFNGVVVQRSAKGDPVHSGKHSWSVTIPKNYPLQGGTGVASQNATFSMNFVPQCHDRFAFWIWSEPSQPGDHTVLVKFFDQGLYKDNGVGIWTQENQRARYQQWTRLEIAFNRLPDDFDWEHVDKIEFFNYWDGTYFYDDIQVMSAGPPEISFQCLRDQNILICPANGAGTWTQDTCGSIYSSKGDFVLELLKTKLDSPLIME